MEYVWSVSKLSTESVGSRRELVVNCVHTADATKQFRCVGGVYWAHAGSSVLPLSFLFSSPISEAPDQSSPHFDMCSTATQIFKIGSEIWWVALPKTFIGPQNIKIWAKFRTTQLDHGYHQNETSYRRTENKQLQTAISPALTYLIR